jgi:hypothetical protein
MRGPGPSPRVGESLRMSERMLFDMGKMAET